MPRRRHADTTAPSPAPKDLGDCLPQPSSALALRADPRAAPGVGIGALSILFLHGSGSTSIPCEWLRVKNSNLGSPVQNRLSYL